MVGAGEKHQQTVWKGPWTEPSSNPSSAANEQARGLEEATVSSSVKQRLGLRTRQAPRSRII